MRLIDQLKQQGKKIVTTNGTFDILHTAHLHFLEKAKSLGDILIVLVNDDASVKRFKGEKRPILNENERTLHLAYLTPVDYVSLFPEDNPLNYLKLIKPHFQVKGGTFIPERIKEEKELLESWGGQFLTFPLEEGFSTTNIIQKIIDVSEIAMRKFSASARDKQAISEHAQEHAPGFSPTVLDIHKDTTDAYKSCPYESTNVFNRNLIKTKPLNERASKSDLSILVNPASLPPPIDAERLEHIKALAVKIKTAREKNRPVIFCFGAHLIKNGLSLILIEMMKKGFITHLAGNGAVSIHDWEFAYHGKTEENVERYIKDGQFGLWEETGKYLNSAISTYSHRGYGSAVGRLIWEEKLGEQTILHQNKEKSVLGQAYNLNVPVSICPGIGYDIIYTHRLCDGAAIGQAAYTDFLKFAKSVSQMEGGVYLSVGSAILSPMIFEKALSMARNVAKQQGRTIENFDIIVNDIQPGTWDWDKGEPPKNHPAYYLRFNKTFSRMGGHLDYIELDNRAFLHNLYVELMK